MKPAIYVGRDATAIDEAVEATVGRYRMLLQAHDTRMQLYADMDEKLAQAKGVVVGIRQDGVYTRPQLEEIAQEFDLQYKAIDQLRRETEQYAEPPSREEILQRLKAYRSGFQTAHLRCSLRIASMKKLEGSKKVAGGSGETEAVPEPIYSS